MKNFGVSRRSVALALAAGCALPMAAQAQWQIGRETSLVQKQVDGAKYPDMVRGVQLVKGRLVPTTNWAPYHRPDGGTRASSQYAFDSVQNVGGIAPNTLPSHGFWLLGWTTGVNDYSTDINAHDMAGIPVAARGQGAKQCDLLIQERDGTQPLYFTIFTAETFDPANPPGASWGVFPGIQFAATGGVGNGFWFFGLDVTANPPPVGDGWMMPADGSGAFIVSCSRDAAGTVPAMNLQFGLWGTGDHFVTPPNPPMVGTEGSLLWADDSTPPQCGAGSLATDIPNHILDSAACEAYDALFNVDPNPLATSIGFGFIGAGGNTGSCCLPNHSCSVLSLSDCGAASGVYNGDGTTCPGTCSVCYPNCDSSTTLPFLNVQDFSCFLTKFASGSGYANCDNSTTIPILNVQDFSCFLTKYATGCSAP